MKNRIIEILELGQPQSIIQRENQPITELIKTDILIKELNQQLFLYGVVVPKGTLCRNCESDDIYNCFLTDVKVCNKCHYQD